MARSKPAGFDVVAFLFAFIVEVAIGIWIGQTPIWNRSPLVIALTAVGFVVAFFLIYKFACRRSDLEEFLAAGRRMVHRKYPKSDPRSSRPRHE